MRHLHVLDQTGDTTFSWDSEAEAQVVRQVFEEMKGKGYLAARMTEDGSRGDLLTEFDPTLKTILMLPPLRGG